MKILTNYRPEKCVSKDKENEAFRQFFVERIKGDKGILSATDGKCLVRIPVELSDKDQEGAVPVDAVAKSRSLADDAPECEVLLLKTVKVVSPAFKADYERFNYLTPPKFQSAIPKSKPKAYAFFNAKHLKSIADAMGTEMVFVEIREVGQPLVIRPDDKSDLIGVLAAIKPTDREVSDAQKTMDEVEEKE